MASPREKADTKSAFFRLTREKIPTESEGSFYRASPLVTSATSLSFSIIDCASSPAVL